MVEAIAPQGPTPQGYDPRNPQQLASELARQQRLAQLMNKSEFQLKGVAINYALQASAGRWSPQQMEQATEFYYAFLNRRPDADAGERETPSEKDC